jgi:aerobic-type carbon monoxide dehydrogenase small subunit (CoxS/CutS family)
MSELELGFVLNGKPVRVLVKPNLTLLDLLRDYFKLTGTKRGCDRGDCGACTVLLDEKPVNSCLILAPRVNGRAVTTVEGLGEPSRLDPLQESFVDFKAVQCGFCSPGMLLVAKALLNENPHPSREQVKGALSGNLCRCTGYTQIIDAIMAVAERTKSR